MGVSGSIKANWSYLGNENDVNQAKARTEQFFKAGADVVYPVAGAASSGAGDATLETANTRVIGSHYDWYLDARHKTYRQNILTSVQMKIAEPVLEAIRAAVKGEFNNELNTAHYGTIDDGSVALTGEHDVAYPAGVLEELSAIKKLITDGELVVF